MSGETDDWVVGDIDRELSAEAAEFLPDRVFDAHAHLYRLCDLAGEHSPLLASGPDVAGLDAFREYMTGLFGSRGYDGLFFGMPLTGVDVDAANDFVAEQVRDDAGCLGALVIRPDTPCSRIEQEVRERGFTGLKGYHLFADRRPTMDAVITDYVSEEQFALAHELGLVVVLHMVRDRALADGENLKQLRRLCTDYTGMKLLLAHAGRCFSPRHAAEGAEALGSFDNVWFDTSAVCESRSIEILLRRFGPERVLWGSDFPVAFQRGRCVAVADGFVWLTSDWVDWGKMIGRKAPALVGLESLLALKQAAEAVGLNRCHVESVFRDNARSLFFDH